MNSKFFPIDFSQSFGQYSGFVLINKEKGISSHTVINRLRKMTGVKRIGHAGTLDPLASGLLIVAISREATRELENFIKLDKEYIATLFLGAETDTYDKEGEILKRVDPREEKVFDNQFLNEKIKAFIGEQFQIPPMYSAKKIKGRKLYELARRGIEVERPAAKINIYDLQIISYVHPILKLRVACSSGTYIRSLAFDLGRSLGCGAYLDDLERTRIDDFSLDKAYTLEEFEKRLTEKK